MFWSLEGCLSFKCRYEATLRGKIPYRRTKNGSKSTSRKITCGFTVLTFEAEFRA